MYMRLYMYLCLSFPCSFFPPFRPLSSPHISSSFLDLSFNNLLCIENLDSLVKLEKLFLIQNKISAIGNLSTLTSLTMLELGSNRVRVSWGQYTYNCTLSSLIAERILLITWLVPWSHSGFSWSQLILLITWLVYSWHACFLDPVTDWFPWYCMCVLCRTTRSMVLSKETRGWPLGLLHWLCNYNILCGWL